MQKSLFEQLPVLKTNYSFQNQAIEETLKEFKRGVDSTALIMATGTGKTYVFSQIAKDFIRRFEKPVLILAHRTELIEQARDVLESFSVRTVIEKAESFALNEEKFSAIVASVQTLKISERLEQFPKDYFSLIITDECHHAVCADNRKIYEYFSGTKHLGVTATPLRHDKVGLKNVYQSVSFQYPIQSAIDDGYLCKIRAKQIKVEGLELEQIKLSNSDFSRTELDELLMREKVLLKMVLPTIEHAGNRPTIIFTKSVKHAKAITFCLNQQSDNQIATYVDGAMDDNSRRVRIDKFKAGEFQFIVNVGVLTEGFDHPPVSCIALFRPTRSLGLLAQMIGRGTRIAENKTDCLILDFVGVNNSVRTCNVLDVLDGTIISDAEHETATRYIEKGEDAKTALEKAKIDVAKIEALEIRWKALSSSKAFDIMKLFAIPSAKGLYGGGLCTHIQRGFLENAGVKVPPTLEKGEASKLIAEIIRRRNEGLATLKQLRYLKRLGVTNFDVDTLAFQEAGRLIGVKKLASNNPWLSA